jgi:primosomal protein N'
VLGPAPLPVVRVRNRYRYHVTVSGKQGSAIRAAISKCSLLQHCKRNQGVSSMRT